MSEGLRHFGLTITRTAEILDQLDLLDDDRVPVFESWLSQRLDGLADGIRRDVEDWLRTLRDGGPRSQPREQGTAMKYLTEIRPVLLDWSGRLDHLREVTRADVLAVRDQLEGSKRHHTVSVLRSLFRHCKKQGTIFRDPAARVRVGRQDYRVLLPLEPHEVRAAVDAATTPVARLALALAAVHAARPKAVRELQLDDVDLGNRRLVLAGRARPLDDLTRQAVLAWLDYRRRRWPNTANPHLIVSQHTAMDTRPVSGVWITEALRGQTATLERLRMDRQLEEALTHGPDPLHLAEVFGLDEKTAIRYANSARQILERPLESDPATSPRTRGATPQQHDDGPSGSY
jgi:site-specific recombinase XerD